MVWRGEAWKAARLSGAAALSLVLAAQAIGQNAPADLDPSAPLDPLPDIGLEWPDLNAAEPATDGAGDDSQQAAPDVPRELADSAAEQPYSVRIEGVTEVGGGEELLNAFRSQSALAADEDANAAQIDRRSRADAELLAELLRANGFYDATVVPRIDRQARELVVVLEAEPGPQYRFASVELPGLEAAGEQADELRRVFAVKEGDPVIAEEVIAAGLALKVALGEQGFASAEVGEQDIEINHQTRTARLVLPVQPGPVARFGDIRVSGRPPFSARHVATLARFDRGDPFKRSEVDDLRRALVATGLVSAAEVRLLPTDGGRTVDLAVQLDPAPARTIAGELGYGTGEGLRAEASWQHRNLINPEGAVTVRGVAGTREQLGSVEFRRNNFGRRDQVLTMQALVSNSDLEAYEAKTALLSGRLERQSNFIWQKTWTWSIGADLLATRERGIFDDPLNEETRDFLIASLPLSLGYDGSDDLLNPSRGFRLSGRASPEFSGYGETFGYTRVQLDASAYRPVTDKVVAAGRIRLGTIVGASASDLAPSRRFYSGGGGSVRGYGYQQLGPKDQEGDPIGGRGLAEFAIEARVGVSAFGGKFGIVPFLDGGSLSRDVLPDLDDWQFGAGLGVRYYSSFGPIRVDVGTPLNPREGDGPIAVTVSLGQAF